MINIDFEDNILTAVIDGADLHIWHDELINTNNTGILHQLIKNAIVRSYYQIHNCVFPIIDDFRYLNCSCYQNKALIMLIVGCSVILE